MGLTANALQLAGLTLVAFGAFLLAPWLGLILAGIALLLVGIVLEH